MHLYIDYALRRLLYAIPILMGVALLIFLLFNVVAGDPTAVLLGKHATANQIAELRHELGLDKPWLEQYVDILKSIFTLRFGDSWATKQDIGTLVKSGAYVSLTLVVPAFIVTTVLAICISLVTAFFRGSILDQSLVVLSVVTMSVSGLAYILFGQWLFAYKLGWFEIAGYAYGFPDFLPYTLLPSAILVMLSIGYDVRFYRTLVLDELYQDYVRTARAKGLAEYIILFRHVLKNALISMVTSLIMEIPAWLLGTVLVESFFGIPGLGTITLNAINNTDFPVIKAMTILSAIFYLIFNIVTDILYTWLDPRIKLY
ncbi:MAG: ABC transporter permease [Bacteroidota bacterium]